MPSSTSNSDSRLPRGPWLRTWALAVAVAGVLLGSWEAYWRLRGWKPMVTGEEAAWVTARLRVRPESVVLLGTSRMGSAIDPLVWAEATGTEPPVTLALRAVSALPVLADLAADTSFRGTAVVEMLPNETYVENLGTPEFIAAAKEARVSPAKRVENVLRLEGPSHWVFRRTELQPARLATNRNAPQPVFYVLRKDQFRPTDFRIGRIPPNSARVLDTMGFQGLRVWGRPLPPDSLDRRIEEIRGHVARIQQRGGQVVFVHLSGCGGRRMMEELVYPREQYWERLREIRGVRMIRSDDYPEISGLPCYDGSHFDVRDAPTVTRWLANFVVGGR